MIIYQVPAREDAVARVVLLKNKAFTSFTSTDVGIGKIFTEEGEYPDSDIIISEVGTHSF